jgi:hypothetical protein
VIFSWHVNVPHLVRKSRLCESTSHCPAANRLVDVFCCADTATRVDSCAFVFFANMSSTPSTSAAATNGHAAHLNGIPTPLTPVSNDGSALPMDAYDASAHYRDSSHAGSSTAHGTNGFPSYVDSILRVCTFFHPLHSVILHEQLMAHCSRRL